MDTTAITDAETLAAEMEEYSSGSAAAVLGARIGLRLLPRCHDVFAYEQVARYAPGYVLAVFRYMLNAMVCAHSWSPDGTPTGPADPFSTLDAVRSSAPPTDVAKALIAESGATPGFVEFETVLDSVTQAVGNGRSYAVGDAARAFRSESEWEAVRIDLAKLVVEQGRTRDGDSTSRARIVRSSEILTGPLWPEGMPEEVKLDWGRVRAALDADRADWSFWIDWYEDVLAERVRNWDLLEAIVQIPDEDWTKGPVHLNWIVAGLVEDHSRNADEIPVNAVRRGLKDNRASLEAQLCALYLMIDEEIERIRGMNPADEFETVQRERQLDFFRRLLAAVAGLRDALPQKGEPTLEEAQKVVGLLKTYLDLFRGWPRENANELVDSTCRVAIVGVCAGLGGLLGAPVIGASIGATMFGGKKIVDAFAQVFKANNP